MSEENTIDMDTGIKLRDLRFEEFLLDIDNVKYRINEKNYLKVFDKIFKREIYPLKNEQLLNKNMFVILKYYVKKNGQKAEWILDEEFYIEEIGMLANTSGSLFIKTIQLFFEFNYFGSNPSLCKDIDREEFIFKYFLWIKKDELPESLEISKENFDKHIYKRFIFFEWSSEQLVSYVKVNILESIIEYYDIKLNKESVLRILVKYFAPLHLIEDYIKSGMNLVINNIEHEMEDLEINFLSLVEKEQERINDSIDNKLRNIVSRGSKDRFKWQSLCKPSSFNVLKNEELSQLAFDEKIPFAETMTKRELCGEFAKRFENVIKGKEKVEEKCINTTSILLTDIKDIPSEFFYSYTHNNKVYCDDIRELREHFKLNGNKNPIDRTVISQRIVDNVNKQYAYLKNATLSLADFDGLPTPKLNTNILTQRATDFTSLLNYPNSTQLYINCTSEKYDEFTNELKSENILSNNEIRGMSVLNLDQRKVMLVDILIIKIRNDVEIANGISSIAINTSNVYNKVFN